MKYIEKRFWGINRQIAEMGIIDIIVTVTTMVITVTLTNEVTTSKATNL